MGDSLPREGGGWRLAGTVLGMEHVGWMALVGTCGVGGEAEEVRPRGPLHPAPPWDDQVKEELGSPELLYHPDEGEPGSRQGSDAGRTGRLSQAKALWKEKTWREEVSALPGWHCFRSSLDSIPLHMQLGRVEIWKEGEGG